MAARAPMPRRLLAIPLGILCLLLAGCGAGPGPPKPIGEAYVGPVTLNIRKDLSLRAPVAASVRHGERLEILQWRRRFAMVRTGKGVEGWIDGGQLLRPSQMERLKDLAASVNRMRSHGRATVQDPLNVHTEPNRQSPSFYLLQEDVWVDVMRHRLEPRAPFTKPWLVTTAAAPIKPPRTRRQREEKEEIPRLPMPPAPKLPDDWLRLSYGYAPSDTKLAPSRTSMDDWTLIRLPDGRAGWVLTRLLFMGIPDEVAQYAEGHRITSYFSLGQVTDRGEQKDHWLWTTISGGLQPHQFDGFRVFVWSTRRHRYETAYIERNLKGFFPVQIHPVEAGQSFPRFSLVVREKNDGLAQRQYAFQGYRVRLVKRVPWQPGSEADRQATPPAAPPPPHAPSPGFWASLKQTASQWRKGLLKSPPQSRVN